MPACPPSGNLPRRCRRLLRHQIDQFSSQVDVVFASNDVLGNACHRIGDPFLCLADADDGNISLVCVACFDTDADWAIGIGVNQLVGAVNLTEGAMHQSVRGWSNGPQSPHLLHHQVDQLAGYIYRLDQLFAVGVRLHLGTACRQSPRFVFADYCRDDDPVT